MGMFQAHRDLLHTTLMHPTWPLLATCSGQRHYTLEGDVNDKETFDHSVKLWSCMSKKTSIHSLDQI